MDVRHVGQAMRRRVGAESSTLDMVPPRKMVSDEDHAVLDADWHRSFDALRAAGLEADADHPIAAQYRSASNAVNHANRSRDFHIATGGTR